MPLFYKEELRKTALKVIGFTQKSAVDLLEKSILTAGKNKEFDVFLSHRFLDAEYILGLKTELEDFGYSVFVDWIEKPLLDRAKVSPETAEWLRDAMKRCKCLLYAISENSTASKWMPWELGYSDGLHGKVAIIPVTNSPSAFDKYIGQEYLGIYPYITKTKVKDKSHYQIWVNNSPSKYRIMRSWLGGNSP